MWRWHWNTFIGLAIVLLPVAVILLILITAASPHDWSHPNFVRDTIQQREWLKNQKRPNSKYTCCSEADSEQVDEEIRYDSKGTGRYWIQSRHTRGEWMLVPEEAIIREPNLHGRPVAWFRWVDGRGSTAAVPRDDMQPVIFCFAPGPLL